MIDTAVGDGRSNFRPKRKEFPQKLERVGPKMKQGPPELDENSIFRLKIGSNRFLSHFGAGVSFFKNQW